MIRRLALLLLLTVLAGAASGQVLVAAAANVKFALDEIADGFRRSTGQSVRIAYGSTGNLSQQIENGAPFQVFVAADEATVERLAANGAARDAGTVYATGRLVLYVPNGSPLNVDLADLPRAVADGRIKRFSIANPEHAPYGRAAQQVLERLGIWQALRPRLVLGENVAQAMQFAASGSAQGGLVPLSLAASPQLRESGRYVEVPPAMHDPVRQRIALLRNSSAAASRFRDYLLSAAAREVWIRHGYAVPGEAR